ncbi:MAG: glycosyltransferase family 39 protein [Anaerolineae bacterium]
MIKRQYNRVFPIGIILFAFALRVYRLDAQSIWVDEGISLHLAASSLAEIIADRAANIHPPLYFFLLKGWVALAGGDVANVYSARFLSAMGSLLQVPLTYAVARRWMGRPTAAIAALLAALSPLSVVYAQEIRAYALLPLVYLALLAITHELIHNPAPDRGVFWLLLGIVEVTGLHLHYTALFLVAYAAAWTILALWKEKRRADLRRWAITQLLAALACLPWLITTLAHWSDIQAEATAGATLAQPPPLGYLVAQIWAFHLTGLTSALNHPALKLLSTLTFLGIVVLLLIKLARPAARRPIAQLLAHWLVPLSVTLIVWLVRPFSPPRYVILYTPGLTLLAAYAMYSTRRPSRFTVHISRITLAISLGLVSILALNAYFFDPAYAKDDVRGVARYLEEMTGPDDLILVTDGDWSLPIVYQGAALVEMPGVADEGKMWANLARWTTHRRRVFVTNYRHGIGGDQRGMILFALENAGTLHSRQSFGPIILRQYQLDRPVEPPALLPVGVDIGPLTLAQGWVETQSDIAVTLALRWRLREAASQRYNLTIRLSDVDGWLLAAHDDALLDAQIRPTDYWTQGQETTTYHILPIPPTTPPLTYSLSLGLYAQTESGPRPLELLDERGAPQGQWLDLAAVHLSGPTGSPGNPYETTGTPPPLPQPADLAGGLQLLGAGLDRQTLGPGQSIFVTLHWQATRSPLPDLRPRLALVQSGQELDAVESAPGLGRYPTDRWRAGETVVEHRRLTVPLAAADGPADVILTVENERLVLGQVEIDAQEHTFSPPPIAHPLDIQLGPVARLIGYDLPSQAVDGASAAEAITLTLYWRAMEGAGGVNYTVFTHILAADGRLVGGHDSPPAEGARPTTGWLPGEIVADRHTMTFREPYIGAARIEVGLYDPITMERVTTTNGGTFILLPTILTIQEN